VPESFDGQAREELFDREDFASIPEAEVLYDDWPEILVPSPTPQRTELPSADGLRSYGHAGGTLIESGPMNGDRSSGEEAP
jgi:hypothetical protein